MSESVAVVTGAGRGFGREIARRLAGRGYRVLVSDIDGEAAEETAAQIGAGAWAKTADVRDPEAHRALAAEAAERGRLDVWVNNAGAMRTVKSWEHPDDEVRLMVDVNFYGVIWGSRAAVDAMRAAPGGDKHLINIGSLSSLAPVPGLAVYGATKHGVLGFTESLQGDLMLAGIPITVHCVCPDGADTKLVRDEEDKKDSAIIWSSPRMLSAEEVADRTVALLDGTRLVEVIPRYRGWQARTMAMTPRFGLRSTRLMHRMGERKREKERRGRA
jgi:NAD(P)-dependent dehydrogenase (short-subunit alcohol dehydrogenase family)